METKTQSQAKKEVTLKQLNNDGFSLVEVLISMMILAIIIIPIFNNLVLSSRINLNAIKTQKATTLVQNVTDGLKYLPILEVAGQFNYDGAGKDFTIINGYSGVTDAATMELLKSGTSYEKAIVYEDGHDISSATASVIKTGTGDDETYTFVPNSSGLYYYGLTDVADGKDVYDVLITYDSTAYSGGTPADPSETGINDVDMPVITSVATDVNAVITDGNRDSWAESTLLHNYNSWFSAYTTKMYEAGNGALVPNNTITNTDIRENMNRSFEIHISHTGTKYEVHASLSYSINRSILPSTDFNLLNYYDSGNYFTPYEDENVYYGQFDTLENIYLFFKPNLYQLSDQITIYNDVMDENLAEVCVCLVQQTIDESSSTQAEIDAYNAKFAGYHLELSVNETLPIITSGANQYYHTRFRMNSALTNKITTSVSNMRINDMIDYDEDKTRIYKKTIQVFKSESNFDEKFDEDNLLATFESSGGE